MIKEFERRSTDIFWSYRWTLGARPLVFFGNPKVSTNVIYTLDELKRILSRSDQDNAFIPVPRKVMQSALDSLEGELTLVA